MTGSVSSADPEKLSQYADIASGLDHELVSRASFLTACLQHFEDTCSDPDFVSVLLVLVNLFAAMDEIYYPLTIGSGVLPSAFFEQIY